jgi:hypothetical protein
MDSSRVADELEVWRATSHDGSNPFLHVEHREVGTNLKIADVSFYRHTKPTEMATGILKQNIVIIRHK